MTLTIVRWGNYPEFEWDEENLDKIGVHGVTWVEAEECFENSYGAAPHMGGENYS